MSSLNILSIKGVYNHYWYFFDNFRNAAWRILCQIRISGNLQKQRLFLCCQRRLQFEYARVCILMCAEYFRHCFWQYGQTALEKSLHNGVFLLRYQLKCKHSKNFTYFSFISILNAAVRLRTLCLFFQAKSSASILAFYIYR